MTKFLPQDVSEEDSLTILLNSYDKHYFLFDPWGIKDKYPDIDGQIRLRKPNGLNLDKYLHFQLKGVKDIKNNKYYCPYEILKYLLNTNVPTVLFIVDLSTETVNWFMIDSKIESLLKAQKKNKGITINLNGREFNKSNSATLNFSWQKIAKKDSYNEINDSLNKIVKNFHHNVRNCVGLLYLLQRIAKNELPRIFSTLLQVEKKEVELIIDKLEKENVIASTSNLYLMENEQVGIDCLFDLINTLSLEKIASLFDKDKQDLKLIHRQLSKIEHPKVNKYLKANAVSILKLVNKPTNNDDVAGNLEILLEYAHRETKLAINIVNKVVFTKNKLSPKKYKTKIGIYPGKSYEDLVSICIDIVSRLRYLESTYALKFILALPEESVKQFNNKIDELVKNYSKYDFEVLKHIGYSHQKVIVKLLKQLSNRKRELGYKVVCKIWYNLVTPSFEGTSMTDYRTLNFSFGALKVNPQLEDIRKQTLEMLKNTFNKTNKPEVKMEILKTIDEATFMPRQGNYGDDISSLVKSNTQEVIIFYTQIVDNLNNSLLQEIDEQVNSFVKRYQNEHWKSLAELENKIASNSEYDLFRIFVGFDYKQSKGKDDWQKNREIRSRKVNQYVSSINESNFESKITELKPILSEYEDIDPSKFQYLFQFLLELGKQNPKLGFRLIDKYEKLLGKLVLHPLTGLWLSKEPDLAIKITKKLITKEKYLTECIVPFNNSDIYEEEILNQLITKAIKSKNTIALNNSCQSCVTHYPKHKKLKNDFIRVLKTLTVIKDSSWVNWVWFQKEHKLLDSLNKNEIKIVLDNLIWCPRIDYHEEEILSVFASKHPELIIDFFHTRLQKSKQLKKWNKRYDELPYSLHQLHTFLQKSQDKVIPTLLKWFKPKDRPFYYQSAHFFKVIFPDITNKLSKTFIRIIKSKNLEKSLLILVVLENYNGNNFIHPIVKEFIVNFPYQDYKSDLFFILSNPGGVTGEYGMAEAYKKRKEEIKSWNNIKSKSISEFLKEYQKYLDNMIKFETKNSDDMVALMKLRVD